MMRFQELLSGLDFAQKNDIKFMSQMFVDTFVGTLQ